eukprot:UN27351
MSSRLSAIRRLHNRSVALLNFAGDVCASRRIECKRVSSVVCFKDRHRAGAPLRFSLDRAFSQYENITEFCHPRRPFTIRIVQTSTLRVSAKLSISLTLLQDFFEIPKIHRYCTSKIQWLTLRNP